MTGRHQGWARVRESAKQQQPKRTAEKKLGSAKAGQMAAVRAELGVAAGCAQEAGAGAAVVRPRQGDQLMVHEPAALRAD